MKIKAKNFENSFFTQKCIQIAISIPNLHLVCFQLSFDVHIVHVGHNYGFSKIFLPKTSKFLGQKKVFSEQSHGKTIQHRRMIISSMDH